VFTEDFGLLWIGSIRRIVWDVVSQGIGYVQNVEIKLNFSTAIFVRYAVAQLRKLGQYVKFVRFHHHHIVL
jgi:hypothetical protein